MYSLPVYCISFILTNRLKTQKNKNKKNSNHAEQMNAGIAQEYGTAYFHHKGACLEIAIRKLVKLRPALRNVCATLLNHSVKARQ
jgi:hypothetical protein